jgi:hypothetical protein
MPFDAAGHQRSVQTRAASKQITPLRSTCYPALRDGAPSTYFRHCFRDRNEHGLLSHRHEPDRQRDAAYRRVLWLVLALNAGMFAIEIGAGLAAD